MELIAERTELITISDLPNEILEYILSLLSPYRDYKNVMLVCHRWHYIMKDVAEREYDQFHEGLAEGVLSWTSHPPAPGPTITERYSQSACYINKCLYVFGGCTAKNTTFNDLWKLDLATAEWIRPLAMGTYPSPKAYASLVAHKDKLILFGGWSHPTPMSLHQSARFFQQLHMYTPETNTWEEIMTSRSPQGLAGHGACVIGDQMVVFGGSRINGVSCSDIWILDLTDYEWTLKTTAGNKPLPRYGHTQMVIDGLHILVVGGCGGANMQFSDVWLLTMDPEEWYWEEISVLNMENCAPQLWCHPACKVGDKMVVLSKVTKTPNSPVSSYNPQIRSPKLSSDAEISGRVRTTGSENTTSGLPSSGATLAGASGTHCCCCQEASLSRSKRTHPETSESSSQESSSDNDDATGHRLQQVHGRGSKTAAQRHGIAAAAGYRRPTSLSLTGPSEARVSASIDENTSGIATASSSKSSIESPENDATSMSPPSLPPSSTRSPHSTSTTPGGRSGLPSIRPNAMRNRQKQLEMLKRYEDRIKGQKVKDSKPHHHGACCHGAGGPCKVLYPRQRRSQNPVYIHTLDVSGVLSNKSVSWHPLSDYGLHNAPEETIFYSLVEGRGELIMFGGIQTDMNNMRRHTQHTEVFSNTVYFLSPKKVLR